MNIDNFMTVNEASQRWDVSTNTLRSRLRSDRHSDLDYYIAKGMLKYFRPEGKSRGEWIITSDFMKSVFGEEKNFN